MRRSKNASEWQSRTSLSTPFNDPLPFAFLLTRRVAVCIVELFIGQVTPFIAPVQLSFINDHDSRFTIQHSRLVNLLLFRKVDLHHNTIITMCNVAIDLFSVIIGLKY